MTRYLKLPLAMLLLFCTSSYSADLTQEELEVSEQFCEIAIITPLKKRMQGYSEQEIRSSLQVPSQESDQYEYARLQRHLTKYLTESLKVKIYPQGNTSRLGDKNMEVLDAFYEKNMPVCLSEFRTEMSNKKKIINELTAQSKKEGLASEMSLTNHTSQGEIEKFADNACQYYLKSPIRAKIMNTPEDQIKNKVNGSGAINSIYNKYLARAYEVKVYPITEKAKNAAEIERFYNANVTTCKKEVVDELQLQVANLKRQADLKRQAEQRKVSVISFVLNDCSVARCTAMRVRSADGRTLAYNNGSLGHDDVRGVNVSSMYGASLSGSYQVEVDFFDNVTGRYGTCRGIYRSSGREMVVSVTVSSGLFGECSAINFY